MKILAKFYWIRVEKKDLLKRVEKYRNQLLEIDSISSPALTGMPSSNNPSNPTEKYIFRVIELKTKMENLLSRISEIEFEIESYLENIEDSEIRTLVRKYYIDCLSWNEITRTYYKSYTDNSTPRKKVAKYLKEMENKNAE